VPSADDTLHLYFLCAHPDLTPSSAVSLTLRAMGGLTTRQIAQAYLVPESTMAQRISAAKLRSAPLHPRIRFIFMDYLHLEPAM
jgi:predicted RNA polymerase sigma factor